MSVVLGFNSFPERRNKLFGHPLKIDKVEGLRVRPLAQLNHLKGFEQATAFQIRYQGKLRRVLSYGYGNDYRFGIRVSGYDPNSIMHKYSILIDIADANAIDIIHRFYGLDEK